MFLSHDTIFSSGSDTLVSSL